MPYTPITALPDAPSRQYSPETFSADADAWVAALPTWTTQTNNAGEYFDTVAADVDADAIAAANSASASATSAGQSATSAGESAASATEAEGYKDTAVVAAAAAQAAAGLPSLVGNSGKVLTVKGDETGVLWDTGVKGTFTATANGSIAAGDLLALESDGTVMTLENTPSAFGTESVYNSAQTTSPVVSRLSDTLSVIAYRDAGNGGFGTAIIATLSGTDQTYGAEAVFSNNVTNDISVSRLTDTSFVICYERSSVVYAIIGTVSGTTISYGTEQTVYSGSVNGQTAVDRLSDTSFIVGYHTASFGRARAATVSGTVMTFGAEFTFNAASTDSIDVASLDSTTAVMVYRDRGASDHGYSRVLSISGTTITAGAETVFENGGSSAECAVTSLSSTDVIICYNLSANYRAVIGQVSGTSISFGSDVAVGAISTGEGRVSNKNSMQAVALYDDKIKPLDISGTTITPGSESTHGLGDFGDIAFISGDQYSIVGTNGITDGRAKVLTPQMDNTSRWIGFSDSAYADAETVDILKLGDIAGDQSGLTTNETYYIDTATAGLTTSTASGIKVGRAVSATDILITGGND